MPLRAPSERGLEVGGQRRRRRRPRRPWPGARNRSRYACRNCRSRPRSPRTPYCASPATGRSIAARWTRIWCVLPVSSLTSRSACSASVSRTSKCVTASRGSSVSSERRVGSRRSRPIGASMRPLARARTPADEREVAAFDLATPDRILERCVRLLRAGDDEEPRGVPVEPMNDPGPLGVVPAGSAQREQLAGERARLLPRSGMHDEPGRLVERRAGARPRRRSRRRRARARGAAQASGARPRRPTRPRAGGSSAGPRRRSGPRRREEPLRERARRDLVASRERPVEPGARVRLSDAETKRRHRAGRASDPTGRRGRARRRGRRRRRR